MSGLLSKLTWDLCLGFLARGLFVLVKPLALWASIQIDSDAGVRLSQIYLVGLVVLSLTGTNAHRPFYRARFEEAGTAGPYTTGAHYLRYLVQLGQQVALVLLILAALALVNPSAALDFIWIGLLFGLAEKISDEEIRYTQFCIDNRRLVLWAGTKVAACLGAVALALAGIVDISIGFPVLLMIAVAALSGAPTRRAAVALVRGIMTSFGQTLRSAFDHMRRDGAQIAWVFTNMGLASLDKWTLQVFDTARLPQYMFAAQIASVFLVAQTVFILAPARVRLLNHNPDRIPALQWGSGLLAGASVLCGVAMVAYSWPSPRDSLLYFPFFLAVVFVMSAPYMERFYWVSRDIQRIVVDLIFIAALCLGLGVQYWLSAGAMSLHISLSWLLIVLFFRWKCVAVLIRRTPVGGIKAYG